ncbi:hypothetical protein L9F63_009401, partial [Diploptera punctata]
MLMYNFINGLCRNVEGLFYLPDHLQGKIVSSSNHCTSGIWSTDIQPDHEKRWGYLQKGSAGVCDGSNERSALRHLRARGSTRLR